MRNALVLVERKARNTGEEPFMSPFERERNGKVFDRNDLQGQGHDSLVRDSVGIGNVYRHAVPRDGRFGKDRFGLRQQL